MFIMDTISLFMREKNKLIMVNYIY